jgi:4-amino-4-deoxychorismate lyase
MFFQKNAVLVEKMQISMEDRAFQYGDGCFSTVALRQGALQLWPRHLQRFADAIERLQLGVDLERLECEKHLFLAHLAQQHYQHGVVKILISRGVGPRGYAMPSQAADLYFYFYPALPATAEPSQIARVGILKQALAPQMPLLRGIKSLNRLEQVLLKQQAAALHWQEALCLDQQQCLVEAIASNCFVFLQGQWCTPVLEHTGIAGTMRQEILARMQHFQIEVQIRMIGLAQLQQIESAFLCNALHPMQIIAQLELRALNPEPCRQLFDSLHLAQLV